LISGQNKNGNAHGLNGCIVHLQTWWAASGRDLGGIDF